MDTLKDLLTTGDPEANFTTVFGFIQAAIQAALALAGMVAFIMILYSSIIYVTAYGDDTKAETAKKTLLWALIGLLAVALSTVIVNMVDRMLK